MVLTSRHRLCRNGGRGDGCCPSLWWCRWVLSSKEQGLRRAARNAINRAASVVDEGDCGLIHLHGDGRGEPPIVLVSGLGRQKGAEHLAQGPEDVAVLTSSEILGQGRRGRNGRRCLRRHLSLDRGNDATIVAGGLKGSKTGVITSSKGLGRGWRFSDDNGGSRKGPDALTNVAFWWEDASGSGKGDSLGSEQVVQVLGLVIGEAALEAALEEGSGGDSRDGWNCKVRVSRDRSVMFLLG